MAKLLYADPYECTGCRICELVCAFVKEGVLNPRFARIRILRKDDGTDKPLACRHCSKPPCRSVCDENAITRGSDGIVRIIATRCIGCGKCIDACPFDAIINLSRDNSICVVKCDLCGECIRFCPPGALKIIDPCVLAMAKRKKILD
jgi:Fe-S-cluster-containing hydrogenase component 2